MCGGFVFALRFNHTVSDGAGLVQFLTAIGEMACGAYAPSIQPLWRRELLNARVPPNISCVQQMYNELQNSNDTIVNDMTLLRSFYFGPQEIEALRNQVDPHLRTTSRFEILTACLWRCRTIALSLNPDDQVSPVVIVNARKIFHPPLPVGFYGNAFGTPVVFSTAGKLCQSPLEYALGLVKKAKAKVTEEFMKSSADFLVKNGRPSIINLARNYMVSDVSRLRFNLDFGWGKAVYGGPTGAFPLETSYYVAYRNKIEDGIVVTVNLPGPAMEKFAVEFEKMIKGEFN
ncbi:hypothetical protein IFM89_019424 [Coptis chinensis]|uniref:Benzyl alcohol O-benzoyltransferase n=1 Tax=Coptis chinensis TaxID=261450 RepID=A0A835M6D0_9MAGN|nr:hypothetical protein IFM89_019424 [Coptis chinensis]